VQAIQSNSIETILVELNHPKGRGRPSKKIKPKLAELLPEAKKEEGESVTQ
jgi:hypothetical protein